MRALGEWLVALAAAGLIGAVFTAVAPEKNRKTMRFASGLLVLLTAVWPLRSLTDVSLGSVYSACERELSARLQSTDDAAHARAGWMMTREAQRFCEDALAALGIDASVSLELMDTDGTYVFSAATVSYRGDSTEEQRSIAAELITAQIGIPAENQTHR